MSNLIFPQSAGIKIERTKTPQWRTVTHIAVSGKETRTAMMSSPRWKFSLSYEFLRDDKTHNELSALVGFYNQLQGGYDTFLYLDPFDNSVTSQQIGVGDGVTKTFQLIRKISAWTETIKDPLNPAIYKDGVWQTSGFTIANGLVTFGTAPSVGQLITWSGKFYFRCRFNDDTMDNKQFMYDLWENSKIEFISVK